MTDPITSGRSKSPPDGREVARHLPPVRRASHATVGVFVIVGVAAVAAVLFAMTDPSTLRGRQVVYTHVGDAGGVRKGDPVQMRGVNVGRVHSFEMLEESEIVQVNLEIERGWRLPIGSSVRLGSPGMFGGRTILIDPGPGPGHYGPGDMLPGIGEGGGGVFEAIEDISETAGSVLERVRDVFDTATVSSVRGGVREFESFLATATEALDEKGRELSELAGSIRAAADSIAAVGGTVSGAESIIARADSLVGRFNRTADELDASVLSLRSILALVESGDGTLGRLLHDSSLYDNSNAAVLAMSELLIDFRENPKKYIDLSIF